MLKTPRIIIFLLALVAAGFFFKICFKGTPVHYVLFFYDSKMNEDLTTELLNSTSQHFNPYDVLKSGNAVMFVETTNHSSVSSLMLCAIESAAQHYPNRPVVFFTKQMTDADAEEVKKKLFSVFAPIKNVHIFPLYLEEILADTPLLSWYNKVNPASERFWAHVSSDASRLALVWKYGGIYMDTDFISLRPIPHNNFLAAESKPYSSNAVLGFSPHHKFPWECMEDFARDFRGNVWGYQGPLLFTRNRNKLCNMAPFNGNDDFMCGNITILGADHFYPIISTSFKLYYEVWDKEPTFNNSYALHLWNYANRNAHMTMVPGSNTLVEHLYQRNCPSVYANIAAKRSPA